MGRCAASQNEMEHIKTSDIISFVTASSLTEEAMATATRVTEHIRSCPVCFARVKDFQDLADGLFSMALGQDPNREDTLEETKDGIGRAADCFDGLE